MELVFIARAVRRYLWFTLGCVGIGLVAGYLVAPTPDEVYETEAWVQIAPNQGAGATATDREVQNQLVVLDSSAIAEAVAAGTGEMDAFEVRQATTFEQVPGSDIIRVVVSTPSAQLSQQVANAYVGSFIDTLESQLESRQAPDLESLDETIAVIETELDAVNEEIEAVLEPYLDVAGSPDAVAVLPALEQLAPSLASQRQALMTQHSELVRLRTDIAVSRAQDQVGTRIVHEAALPTQTVSSRPSLLLLAGPLAGLVVGALAAVTLARLSPRVLDVEEITATLGFPVAGSIPARRYVGPRSLFADPVPPELEPAIHELCVRAEASGTIGRVLTVMVAGASGGAGATTVSIAMASHFARSGPEVVLVDADVGHPQLSGAVGESVSGIELLLDTPVVDNTSGRRSARRDRQAFTGTDLPGVGFAGLGPAVDGYQLRREDVPDLIDQVSRSAEVVVFDAGMLMDAASNLELSRLVDVLVLCIPEKRQRAAELDVVGRQLAGTRGTVLPVLTRPTRPAMLGRWASRPEQSPDDTASEPDPVGAEASPRR